jgi:hypothetical protein
VAAVALNEKAKLEETTSRCLVAIAQQGKGLWSAALLSLFLCRLGRRRRIFFFLLLPPLSRA